MHTLQTARSLHSPLPLPPGAQWRGPSPSPGHPGVPSIFSHRDGAESTLGFHTGLTLLQRGTTIFNSIHIFVHTVAFLLITIISPGEDSGEAVPLRKAEKREKPQMCWSKRSQGLRKDSKKICAFSFQIKQLGWKIMHLKLHWLEIVLLVSSERIGL